MKDLLKKIEEITDIDSKFLKTILHLFLRPKKVILTNNSSYTSSTKYTLIVVTGIFFISAFVDQISIKEFQRPIGTLPLRVQFYEREIEKILEEFGSFIVLFTLIPILAILLRLVYYESNNWRNSFRVSLYINSQSIILFSLNALWKPLMLVSIVYWFYAIWVLYSNKKRFKSALRLLVVFIPFLYTTTGWIADFAYDVTTNSLNRTQFYYPLVLSSTDDFLENQEIAE